MAKIEGVNSSTKMLPKKFWWAISHGGLSHQQCSHKLMAEDPGSYPTQDYNIGCLKLEIISHYSNRRATGDLWPL